MCSATLELLIVKNLLFVLRSTITVEGKTLKYDKYQPLLLSDSKLLAIYMVINQDEYLHNNGSEDVINTLTNSALT